MEKLENVYLSLNSLIDISTDESGSFDCGFGLEFDEGEIIDSSGNSILKAYAHEASVSYGDILLFTDKGTFSYVIDYYGDNGVAELFDWDVD